MEQTNPYEIDQEVQVYPKEWVLNTPFAEMAGALMAPRKAVPPGLEDECTTYTPAEAHCENGYDDRCSVYPLPDEYYENRNPFADEPYESQLEWCNGVAFDDLIDQPDEDLPDASSPSHNVRVDQVKRDRAAKNAGKYDLSKVVPMTPEQRRAFILNVYLPKRNRRNYNRKSIYPGLQYNAKRRIRTVDGKFACAKADPW